MRLIQPTLLLLLPVAFHNTVATYFKSCTLIPNNIGPNCIPDKCPIQEAACKNKINCMGYYNCTLKYCGDDHVNCHEKCVPDDDAQKLFQCAVDQQCIPHTLETCPGESDKDKKKPDTLELVAQLTGNTWLGMYTSNPNTTHGFFNYPCLKLDFSGNRQKTILEYSYCYGDLILGICSTNIITTNGYGEQRGRRHIIDLKLAKKDFLLNTAYITIYVHTLVEGKFAFVSFCFKDDINVFSSEMMVISPFWTYDEMVSKSADPEATKKQFWAAIKENYRPSWYPMEKRHCKN